MCGIAGFSCGTDCVPLFFDGGGVSERLSAATGALEHRGPDDSGQFVDASAGIGLGHRRL